MHDLLCRNEMSAHGVVLYEHYAGRRWFVTSLSSSGEICAHVKTDIVFTYPGLADKNLTSRCGVDEITQRQTEIMARVEVLKRIRDLERRVENYYNTIGKTIHTLYPKVKSPDPDKWSRMSLFEAARLLLPIENPSPIALFAVHKQLLDLNKEFVVDGSYQTTRSFSVRPQSHLDRIHAITEMSRLRNGPLDAFARRAQIVIATNKRMARDSWGEPPSERRVDKPIFTSEDRIILEFLLDSLRQARTTQRDPYTLGRAAIIKRLDLKYRAVNDSVVYDALLGLGIIPPWQDLVSRAREADLYQGPEETSPKVIQQNAIVLKAFTSKPTPRNTVAPSGPQDFYPFDPAESVRHDFGDMPVYVIDDVVAEELDDGVSIETIPSEPDSCWVHVHVADPTAVIPPTHVFAQQARAMTGTAYYIHRTWPMLPKSLMSENLSLGSASAKGEPERVLTFSFKVDDKGCIPEYKVRAGLVRNLHILSYDGLDAAMGFGSPQMWYPFGRQPPPPPAISLDQSYMNNLRAMKAASDRLITARLKSPSFGVTNVMSTIRMSHKTNISATADISNLPLYRGFPQLTYEVSSGSGWECGSRQIVSEFMKGACRVASRFCLDHRVPALRRVLDGIQVSSDKAKLLALRDSSGYVDYLDCLRHDLEFLPARYSLEPKMHWSLGIPEGEGYSRVTSPLRRYSDMVTHWQIKHVLLPTSPSPPFSEEELLDLSKTLVRMEKLSGRMQKVHNKFWSLLYIQRWLEDPRRTNDWPNPLNGLVAYVTSSSMVNPRTKDYQCPVSIPALGLDAVLGGLSPLDEMAIGQEIPVKIDIIQLGVNPKLAVLKR